VPKPKFLGGGVMTIIVTVTIRKNNESFGRYCIPKEEYPKLIEYLIKKSTEELLFKTRLSTCTPDFNRIWNIT
jgi:hypothetical protein